MDGTYLWDGSIIDLHTCYRDTYSDGTYLCAGGLGCLQQVRYGSCQVLGCMEKLSSVASLVLHQSRQKLHPAGHLRQVRTNGCDCAAHRCVIRVCGITYRMEASITYSNVLTSCNLQD